MKDASPGEQGNQPEMAAGGLVWRRDATGVRLGLVYRTKHRDWTLPKGRQEPGEDLRDTALREAMEETGSMAVVQGFAGTYHYDKNGHRKEVRIWHMLHCPEPYAKAASREEIGEVVWLTLEEALDKLTHPGERDFVACHEES